LKEILPNEAQRDGRSEQIAKPATKIRRMKKALRPTAPSIDPASPDYDT
jgi:hypothetical protein